MALIDDFTTRYSTLESRIRALMTALCSQTCGLCTACCCRADICEEVAESAFLSRLLRLQKKTADHMDPRYGWLDLDGCSLEYGRPPVCYAYFCDELLARLPDQETVLAAQTLGRLLFHIGLDALDGLHLTEIRNTQDLERVNVEYLMHRLDEAEAAFRAIDDFFSTGRMTAAGRATLDLITTEDP